MPLDIVSVAFGFTDPRAPRETPVNGPPPTYTTVDNGTADIYPTDAPVFAALKKSLNQTYPRGSLCFGRQWALQVEGPEASQPDGAAPVLHATFRRVDFFITTWTAAIHALMPFCSSCPNLPVEEHSWSWEALRHRLPKEVSAVRLWGSSLPTVLKQTKLATGHSSLKGSFGSITSTTSNASSPKSALLKFTQSTLTVPIRTLVAPPSAGSAAGGGVGDGVDFATSRVLRMDVLRSALNELALLMLGGGASPSEDLASEPSVPETETYRSSIGIVGLQVAWAPPSPPLSGKVKAAASSTSSASNGPSDGEHSLHGCNIVARDVVLEIQLLSQTSSNAGKKAIDMAIRELLPSFLLEPPSCLSIGVANQHDGSVHNVSLSTPPLTAQSTPHHPVSAASTPLARPHTSWSAAVVSGTPKSSTKHAASAVSAGAAATFPGLGPSVASRAEQPSSPDSSTKKKGSGAPSASTVQPTEVPTTVAATLPAVSRVDSGPLNAATADDAAGKKKKKIARKSATEKPAETSSDTSPTAMAAKSSTPTSAAASQSSAAVAEKSAGAMRTVLEDDIMKQSHILLMHARDISLMEMQFEEMLHGPKQPQQKQGKPPKKNRAEVSTDGGEPGGAEPTRARSTQSSLATSLSSSTGAATVPAVLAAAETIVSEKVLSASNDVITFALTAARGCCVFGEIQSFAQGDMESTIGPASKMLKLTIGCGDTERMTAYRQFQQDRKILLMDAVSAYSTLFGLAESIIASFEEVLEVAKSEACAWSTLERQHTQAVASMLSKKVPRKCEKAPPLADSAAPTNTSKKIVEGGGGSQKETSKSPPKVDASGGPRGAGSTKQLPKDSKSLPAQVKSPRSRHDSALKKYMMILLVSFAVAIVAALFL